MKKLVAIKLIELLYLQMYSPDPEDPPADPPADPPNDPPTDPPAKTFSQSDMDKVVGKEKAKAAAKAAAKAEKALKETDDYKGYQAYLDSKKTEDEKTQEKLGGMSDLEKTNKTLTAELESYKNKAALSKSGVSSDHEEFVLFEINKLITEDTDFEAALETYKADEKKEQYFGEQQRQSGRNTGRRQNSGGSGDAGSRKEKMLANLGYGKKPAAKK